MSHSPSEFYAHKLGYPPKTLAEEIQRVQQEAVPSYLWQSEMEALIYRVEDPQLRAEMLATLRRQR